MISWFEKRKNISLTIAILIGAAIFAISSISFPPSPYQSNLKAMIYHISAFFFFSFFLFLATIKKESKLFPIPILMSILYGISDEIHQYFVPGRYLSLNDIFLDTVGISLAFMVYYVKIAWAEMQS